MNFLRNILHKLTHKTHDRPTNNHGLYYKWRQNPHRHKINLGILAITILAITISFTYILPSQQKYAHAAGITKYARTAGGNWSADATWSTTSGGGADTVVPTSSDDVVFNVNSGNVTIDATSVAKTLNCTGYTNTLTHNTFTLTVSGSITFVSTMTYTPLATSTVIMAATGTLTTGTKLMPLVTNLSGLMTLGDNLSFMASQIMQLKIATAVNLNGKTVSGNSTVNRLLVTSYYIGTSVTVTISGGTFANADFQDIAFANGGANLDLSGITGGSGDCGGNSMSGGGTLTFTTAAPQTWDGTSNNWSTSHWTSRVPLPQDDVNIGSGTVTGDMPRLGRSITITGSPIVNLNQTVNTIYGSLTLASGMTLTKTYALIFAGRGSYYLTSAGKILGGSTGDSNANAVTISMVGGSLTMQDAFSCTGHNFGLSYGGINTNGYGFTIYSLIAYGSTTRSITLGSSTVTTSAGLNLSSNSNLSVSASSSTILINHLTASMTFAGANFTYGDIKIAPGSGATTFSGAFSFANMTMSSAGAKTVKFTKSTTYTMTGTNFLTGTAGNLVTIDSDDGATQFTLTKSTGTNIVDYVNMSRAAITGTGKWYLTPNSVGGGNTQGNSGWTTTGIKTASPAGGNNWDTTAWNEGVVPVAADNVFFIASSGNVTVGTALDCNDITQVGYTNILTQSAQINARGNVTLLPGKFVASADGWTLYMLNTSTLITGGNAMGSLWFNKSGGTLTLGDNYTGRAGPMVNFYISSGTINLNGKTVSGNSSTNRIIVRGYTVGTAGSITVNGGTFANADFQDIAFANGGSNLDLSAITGLSGDCGGNSMSGGGTLTFTGSTTQTWNGTSSGNWSTNVWSGHVPLPQDTVAFGTLSTSQTITVDMPRIGKDVSFAGATNTPTVLMNVAGMTSYSVYGSLNLTGIGTFTAGSNNNSIYFMARTNSTLTSASKAMNFASFRVYMPGYTLTLADALTETGGTTYIYNGTLSSAYSMTLYALGVKDGAILTLVGSPTVTCNGSGAVWSTASSGVVNAGTSTIALTYNGSTASTFAGGTNSYNNITIVPGSGVLTFSGAFSFANMTMSSVGTKTVKFTKSTTYTMTGTNFLNGTSGNLVTVDSDDGATQFTLTKASGTVIVDYVNMSRAAITGTGKWYLTPNSVGGGNTQGNTGWTTTGIATVSPAGGNWTSTGTWNEGVVPSSGTLDTFFIASSGNVTISSSAYGKSITQVGYTNTLTHSGGNCDIAGSITLLPGKYMATSDTAEFTIWGTNLILTTGGNAMGFIYAYNALTLADDLTFRAGPSAQLSVYGALNQNGKTISGNSATNRVLIHSNTVGTPHTITVAGGAFANADFQDIAFANGGASLDLSAITGLSGDCGGNSTSGGGTLTLTPATTQTFTLTGGSWSNVAKWTSRVPLPQDTAVFGTMDANQTITIDMPRLPATNFSAITNTPTVLMNVSGLTYSWYGSANNPNINLTGVGTFTSTMGTFIISRANIAITSANKSFTSSYFYAYVPGATLTLADTFVCGTNIRLYLGTLTTNYAVTCGYLSAMSGTTMNMGSGTWTLSSGGSVWIAASGTINAGTSTIALTSTNISSFDGGTNTYNNITIAPGSGVLTFSGAFSFANMTMSGAGTKTVKFTKSTQYNMTGTSFLSGTSGNVVTIDSDDGATAFTLSKSSGIVTSNYLSIKNSTATGGAKWYGANSTNAGNNSGWMFAAKSPGYVSASPSGYSRTNSFTFSWAVTGPDAALYANKYQYRISPSGTWIDVPGDATTSSISPTAPAYQIGSNVFYLRAVDITGNADPSGPQTTFYYNADAPSAPVALTADPSSSVTNSFSFSWTPPVTHSGNISGYYYSINSLPTITNSTFTTATSLPTAPYATQQGTNTIYVLAKDEAGNVSFDSCSSISGNTDEDSCSKTTFDINAPAPGQPTALRAIDGSDRDNHKYRVFLSWSAPETPGLGFVGYEVYRSTDALNFTSIGTTRGTNYADTGLTSQPYFYFVKSFDNINQHSPATTPPVLITPTGRYTSAPLLSEGPSSIPKAYSATIAWETDREASTIVTYSKDSTNLNQEASKATEQVKAHSLDITGLDPESIYYYKVVWVDIDANKGTSDMFNLQTSLRPKIQDVKVTNITLNSATVSWTSATISTSTVNYGKTNSYGSKVVDQSGSQTTNHTLNLDNLSDSSTYHFQITGTDTNANNLASDDYSFDTLVKPFISELNFEPVKDAPSTSIKFTFKTNVPTTTIIDYQANGTKELVDSNSEYVTSHEITIKDLADQADYSFQVKGADQFSNIASSDKVSFTTPNDTRPPKISRLTIEIKATGFSDTQKAQIVATWQTDEPSTSQVQYGKGIAGVDYPNKTNEDSVLTNNHVVIVSELEPNNIYHLRVASTDGAGNIGYSPDTTTITGKIQQSVIDIIIESLKKALGWMFNLK
jgi:hypothetical protein